MADITMCNGKNCPLRKKCYRYTATPGNPQSYFIVEPYNFNKCDQFVDNKFIHKWKK
jgi:hypothetical protein